MNEEVKNKKKRLRLAFALALLVLITIFFSNSKSELLENDTSVKSNSELTYYLNVSYDGVDRNGLQSSDTKVSKLNSGVIFVEDKLPEGLEFIGFVTTEDGTIGAVKRDDESICTGKVVDDTNEESNEGKWNEENTEYTYHGLHYSKDTNTVTFKVKYLQAGCKLSVGIITKTPPLDDPDTEETEYRRDFYNFATARERTLNARSNTVHVFMGRESPGSEAVVYLYEGTPPDNAPPLPEITEYTAGAKVGVAANPKMEGYTFSGWTSENVEVTNGTFTMPNDSVIFKGSFTRDNDYKVTYQIEGDIPEQYENPSEKRYYPGTVVELDTLKKGDIINGYRFKGWTSDDVEITREDDFTMPEGDITLKGSFEEEKYKVTYMFREGTQPPNADELLPAEQEYRPGEEVTLEEIEAPSGYEFLGWYEDSEFEMPQENVVILGEWKAKSSTFQIWVNMLYEGSSDFKLHVGETAECEFSIYNYASFEIKDVMVEDNLDDVTFTSEESNIERMSDHIIKIPSIPANSSYTFKAYYQVKRQDKGNIDHTMSVIGASAGVEGYELADGNYSRTQTIYVGVPFKLCLETEGSYNDNTFQFEMKEIGYGTVYNTTLKSGDCKVIYLRDKAYTIKEIVPQEYEVVRIETSSYTSYDDYKIDVSFNPISEEEKIITFVNRFRKKNFLHSFDRIDNRITYSGGGG